MYDRTYRRYRRCIATAVLIPQSLHFQAQLQLLMSYVKRLREVMISYISLFLHSERTGLQQPPDYVAAAVVCLRQKDVEVCQTRTEGCHAKCRGVCVNVILHCLSEMLGN